MADILIFDTETGRAKKLILSAHTPDFVDRLDALINPVIPAGAIKDMIVVDDVVREMTVGEKTARDAELAAAANAAEQADLMNISFNDMPVKLPGLAWMLIESVGLTEDEKDLVITSDALNIFHRYIRNGFIQRGVDKLNLEPAPAGVDATKWATLLAQVNALVGNE